MAQANDTVPIDDNAIASTLERHRHGRRAGAVGPRQGPELKGLGMEDVAVLGRSAIPNCSPNCSATARQVKQDIYGSRLVLFAPLYVSNLCGNNCLYCAFRSGSQAIKRRALNQEEIAHETKILVDQGHKRVLLVAGESYPRRRFRLHSQGDKDGVLGSQRPRRDPTRQREHRTAGPRAVPAS